MPLRSGAKRPGRILMVEDDVDIRRLNTEALIHCGYQVDTAEDGAVAWEALNRQDYDLMITDNTMPRMTGVELLKQLHGAGISVPTIMATSAAPKGEFEHHPWLKPAAMLIKPYTVAALLGKVREVLRIADINHASIAPALKRQSQPLPNHLPL